MNEATINNIITSTSCRYGDIYYFKHDDPIGKSFEMYGEWAENEIEFLLSLLSVGNTVIDVGANIGSHTMAFASKVGASGKVISFEPQPIVGEVLEKNIKINKFTNVEVHLEGVSGKIGNAFIPIIDYSEHKNIGAISLSNQETKDMLKVPVNTIDTLNLSCLDLIKIDAEQMGQQVIAGMSETIKRCRPLIFCECNDIEEAFLLTQRMGQHAHYQVYVVQTSAFNSDNYKNNSENFFHYAWESNLLFVPEEHYPLEGKHTEKINVILPDNMTKLYTEVYKTPRYEDKTPYNRDFVKLNQLLQDKDNRIRNLESEQFNSKQLQTKIKQLEFRCMKFYKKNIELKGIISNFIHESDQLKNLDQQHRQEKSLIRQQLEQFNTGSTASTVVPVIKPKKKRKGITSFIEKNSRSVRRIFTRKKTGKK